MTLVDNGTNVTINSTGGGLTSIENIGGGAFLVRSGTPPTATVNSLLTDPTVYIQDNGVNALTLYSVMVKATVLLSSTTYIANNDTVSSVTYNNTGGVSGRGQITANLVASGMFDLDSFSVAVGNRLLIKDENMGGGLGGDANGIYVVSILGATMVLDRAADFDADDEVVPMVQVPCVSGYTQFVTTWTLISQAPLTVGGASGSQLLFWLTSIQSTDSPTVTIAGVNAGVQAYGNGVTVYGNQTATNLGPGTDDTVIGYGAALALDTGDNPSDGCTVVGSQAYQDNVNGDGTAIGAFAMQTNTGEYCTAVGAYAMQEGSGNYCCSLGYQALASVSAGVNNCAFGAMAMGLSTGGGNCVAIGFSALQNNETGADDNIAIGANALQNNTTGADNVAVGALALQHNTTGGNNVAIGESAMTQNMTGIGNIALGRNALGANVSGQANTALGYNALTVATASYNTAAGFNALTSTVTGTSLTAVGFEALSVNVSGNQSTACGYGALLNSQSNNNSGFGSTAAFNLTSGSDTTAIGNEAGTTIITGTQNTLLGSTADVTATTAINRIVIGYAASGTADNTCVIGNSALTGGVQSFGAYANISDARFKEDVAECDLGLSFIQDLKPKKFHMVQDHRDNRPYEYGVIAQELKEVLEQHQASDFGGLKHHEENDMYFVSYSSFIAPMIAAIQELAARVEELERYSGPAFSDGR